MVDTAPLVDRQTALIFLTPAASKTRAKDKGRGRWRSPREVTPVGQKTFLPNYLRYSTLHSETMETSGRKTNSDLLD